MLQKVLFACLASSLLGGSLHAEELISWHENLDQARQISQQYKVPILIHFYGDQCMPCKALEKNVFTRPEVASTMQRYFVPVRINATEDRRTAAEFGVHSWPTDVFVGPDGKVLTQGICNQNANAYLQNLQSVALTNRDRNAMLSGNSPSTAPSGSAAYGRTGSANLQQAAPGRDQAPSPYTNASNGANPYAAQNQPSGLADVGQSSLPSPTWTGQSAHGQATNGLVGSGPLAAGSSMNVLPTQSAMNSTHKDPNLPPAPQWQAVSGMSRALAEAPTVDNQAPAVETAAAQTSLSPARGSIVENPHFAAQPAAAPSAQPATAPPNQPGTAASSPLPSQASSAASGAMRMPGQLVSHARSGPSATPEQQSPQASVPALSGFCPVALFASGQWTEGKPEHAVRHRGRIYFLSSPEAVQKFLAAPDSYSPVLSGYDPLIFLSQGRLVEGSVYDGLKDPTKNQILLFATPENKKFFQDNFDRLAGELAGILTPAQPLTASAQPPAVTR